MQYDENKLISLMENFSGSKFQWIKTDRPELLGKVVTCRNIEPRGNKFFAVFDDGSSVDTANLNRSLLMIHGDMQPLSKAEVESIYSPRPSTASAVQNMTLFLRIDRIWCCWHRFIRDRTVRHIVATHCDCFVTTIGISDCGDRRD